MNKKELNSMHIETYKARKESLIRKQAYIKQLIIDQKANIEKKRAEQILRIAKKKENMLEEEEYIKSCAPQIMAMYNSYYNIKQMADRTSIPRYKLLKFFRKHNLKPKLR